MIEIRTGIKYEYTCLGCKRDYVEQRSPDEPQFFTHCQQCRSEFELVSSTEFQYEQEIPDPIVVEVSE